MSFRHGATNPKRDGQFKMNVVYYDGHAETIDDVTARNPSLWLPRNTIIQDVSKVPADVQAQYKIVANTVIN